MNLNYLTFLVLSLTVASVNTVASAQASSTAAPAVISADCANSTGQATSGDLAQEIAQLEVERVLLEVKFNQVHPVFAELDERQEGLQACLTQLQPDNQDLLTAANVGATESKIAEIEVIYANNQSRYADHHPEQQYLRESIAALRQHLDTLL
ncbi:MAG: hypothetical protein HC840_09430 [Leptolyngbyaceae cyanobacterium RM2_2_4]|nr:hypothetical protein [Leptolyngbyaceae cyanobacterium RM2_2_4]